MTDKETLLRYRLNEAEETLHDAEKMLQSDIGPRSIINRAYYSMFYAVLALFLHSDINPKTSKHVGVISIFDSDFIHAGKIDKYYSKILHKLFETRQLCDYRELVELSLDDARESVNLAKEFLNALKQFMGK